MDISAIDTTETSIDTTWNASSEEDEENFDPNNETKCFKLRSTRIESKDGMTLKYTLTSVVAQKERKASVVPTISGLQRQNNNFVNTNTSSANNVVASDVPNVSCVIYMNQL